MKKLNYFKIKIGNEIKGFVKVFLYKNKYRIVEIFLLVLLLNKIIKV